LVELPERYQALLAAVSMLLEPKRLQATPASWWQFWKSRVFTHLPQWRRALSQGSGDPLNAPDP
jgi:hypothetical protein